MLRCIGLSTGHLPDVNYYDQSNILSLNKHSLSPAGRVEKIYLQCCLLLFVAKGISKGSNYSVPGERAEAGSY